MSARRPSASGSSGMSSVSVRVSRIASAQRFWRIRSAPDDRGVALVEQEVEHREDGRRPLGQQVRGRDPVGDAGVADLLLRPHEPLGHRRLGDEEGAGDLGRREPDEGPQRERDACLEPERGVTAGEDQTEPVVLHAAAVRLDRLRRPGSSAASTATSCSLAVPTDARRSRSIARLRAVVVSHAPGARDAVAGPAFQGPREGVLRALFGEVPVAGHADERGDDLAPVVDERGRDRRLDVGGYISQIGLTSIEPPFALGILAAMSMASSRSFASTR